MIQKQFVGMLVCLFLIAAVASAQTIIPGGDVSGTWDVLGSPYLIEGDITVPSGETLNIKPGVEVIFQSWYKLTVNGYLEAVGTASNLILFTAPEPGPPGPGPGWLGIRFINAPDSSHLSFCIIEHGRARAAAPYDRGGGIYCENSNPVISDSIIRENFVSDKGGAIYCLQSAPIISGNIIIDNLVGYGASGSGGGIYCQNSNPQIIGNIISENEVSVFGGFGPARGLGGGIFLDNSNATISNNIINENNVHSEGNAGTYARGGGIYCGHSAPQIIGNTISGNAVTAFFDAGDGGGIYISYSNPTIVNTIVEGSTNGGIYFYESQDAYVAYGDFNNNNDGDFTGDNIPPGLGEIVTVNANGDPCDVNFNIFLSPMFINPTGGDYHLEDLSHCIGAGIITPEAPPYDFEGDPRPNPPDSYPDIGADENPNDKPSSINGAINGYVTNIAGGPLRALVIAVNDKTKVKAVTDVDGYYEILDLEAGIYWVLCIKKGYKPGIKKAEVKSGETTTVGFQLLPQ
ncbi:carboxypeptidase regulatory-like domain-containing protein [bacterium]|nr:carboxypeptidase regulatory-like domain-containing protein [bacterium]